TSWVSGERSVRRGRGTAAERIRIRPSSRGEHGSVRYFAWVDCGNGRCRGRGRLLVGKWQTGGEGPDDARADAEFHPSVSRRDRPAEGSGERNQPASARASAAYWIRRAGILRRRHRDEL